MTESSRKLPPIEERPLVTFALFAYNQEKYIREAVNGAFAQTYEPLEIIISDDCSKDRTYEIIKEMVASYNGAHIVHINQNMQNLGIGPHVSFVHSLSHGELIVHAAGDDISLAERTSELFSGWVSSYPRPSLIVSDGYKINADGYVYSDSLVNLNREIHQIPADRFTNVIPMLGCTVAVSRELINRFSTLPKGLISEDALFYKRANLLNGIKFLPKKIIKYRSGLGIGISSAATNSPESYINFYSRWAENSVLLWKHFKDDVEVGLYDSEKLLYFVNKKIRLYEAKHKFLKIKNNKKLASYLFFCLAALNIKEIIELFKIALVIKTPNVFRFIKFAKKFIQK